MTGDTRWERTGREEGGREGDNRREDRKEQKTYASPFNSTTCVCTSVLSLDSSNNSVVCRHFLWQTYMQCLSVDFDGIFCAHVRPLCARVLPRSSKKSTSNLPTHAQTSHQLRIAQETKNALEQSFRECVDERTCFIPHWQRWFVRVLMAVVVKCMRRRTECGKRAERPHQEQRVLVCRVRVCKRMCVRACVSAMHMHALRVSDRVVRACVIFTFIQSFRALCGVKYMIPSLIGKASCSSFEISSFFAAS